jgi:hemerythrin-like metal-binding protein
VKREAAPILAWSDQLATGLADIDSEHRHLIDIINELGKLRALGTEGEELRTVLAALRNYALYHFRTEANLMYSWPVNQVNKAAHLKAHRSFITYITKASELAVTSPSDVIDHLLAFLVKWLVHHITGVDARMAAEVLALRSGTAVAAGMEKNTLHDSLIDTVSDLYDSISVRTFEMLELNSRLQAEIEQRRRTERELVLARDAATASDREKSEFIANMSHEIRTPMNGILGMIELACDTELTPEQREYLEFARSSADGLLTIINDLLDFSKVDARKLTLECLPFDLRKTLHDIKGPMELRARQKGLYLNVNVDPDLPRFILGDMPRLRQILLNLLNNALKFTDYGGVEIRATLKECTAENMRVLFSVKDTGIGIAAEMHKDVFEPFVQADASISRNYGGTGLGLAICGMLSKLMNGHVWVESTPGEGSTFFFDAWFGHATGEIAVDAAKRAGVEQQSRHRRALEILLVEDNLVNQKFALTVLAKAGHHATLASNGQEAIKLMDGRHFDVIFMDIQMPGMDGFAASRVIRDMGIGTPIIAMTAHAMVGLNEAITDAGMTDYLAKPVQAKELLEKIDSLMDGQAQIALPEPLRTEAGSSVTSPIVSLDEAMRVVDGDTVQLKVLAQMVLDQIDADLPAIRLHVAEHDSSALQKMAHRLKGSLGCVGATSAFAACKLLDSLAKDGITADYAAAFGKLELEAERLRPLLHDMAAGLFANK